MKNKSCQQIQIHWLNKREGTKVSENRLRGLRRLWGYLEEQGHLNNRHCTGTIWKGLRLLQWKKKTFRKVKHISRRISSNHSTDLGDVKEFAFTKSIYKSKKFLYVGYVDRNVNRQMKEATRVENQSNIF